MSAEEAQLLDTKDKDRGVALHQHGFVTADLDKAWRLCTDEELKDVLQRRVDTLEPSDPPSSSDLLTWGQLGLLPPGQGGRDKTVRKDKELKLLHVGKATSDLEAFLLHQNMGWLPQFDWIPRPLSCGTKYFLVFFSGHRRFADIASWVTWQGDVQPLCVDLAIDPIYGNVLEDHLWRQLIAARRVVGAHAAPPCETYTLARWMEIPDAPAPRPLRDSFSPWGRDGLTLAEVQQCHVGTVLMFRALQLLLLTFCYGGSFSLEHPKGANNENGRWTIWDSAFVKQLLLLPRVQRIDFIQGPLGQPFTKPTSMLVGRLDNFAHKLFSHYQPHWRPSEWLGGKDSDGRAWKTAKAKAYPPLLCKVIAESHMEFAATLQSDGNDVTPSGLEKAVEALDPGYDPYLLHGRGTAMASDYSVAASRQKLGPIFQGPD